MQTFLPYQNYLQSAKVLDRKRLGKQRVEAFQIYNATLLATNGWHSHPAVQMWMPYQGQLMLYGVAICMEWQSRGYKDTMLHLFMSHLINYGFDMSFIVPPWLGNSKLHSSHRAALLKKDPSWYRQFGWREDPAINYWWPTKHGQ